MNKKFLVAIAVASVALTGGLMGCSALASNTPPPARFNSADPKVGVNLPKTEVKKDDTKKAADPQGEIKLDGTAVDNIRPDRNTLVADFCRNSKLPAGEGKEDKGGTCVSQPIGEVAKNPVRISIPNAPTVVSVGQAINLDIRIEDRFGPIDLNAFTHDENNKAGDTFLESPGELDKDGRPLAHCHLGVTTLTEKNGLPGESYDAAFKGVQGFKGDVHATIDGLNVGFYRADVYCSEPGHASLPTAKATNVQAFASFNFQVN